MTDVSDQLGAQEREQIAHSVAAVQAAFAVLVSLLDRGEPISAQAFADVLRTMGDDVPSMRPALDNIIRQLSAAGVFRPNLRIVE